MAGLNENITNSAKLGLTGAEFGNLRRSVEAFVCTTCKRQLLLALLQLIVFVCTTAIDNFLCTTTIVNFCMHYY